MNKLLVITYYWPPSGGAGVQRWLKLVKYLAQMGWEVHVITVDPEQATYPQRDASLPQELDGNVMIHHTDTREPYRYYTFFSGGKVPSAGFANEGTGSNAGPIKRLTRFVRGNVFIPDPRKGWNRFAEQKAIDLIDRHGIRTVITTSPPHSSQLIGLSLKKQRDIRWLADMRDPWTGIYYADELRQTDWAKAKNLLMERQVLQTADGIITVSEHLKRDFLKLHPTLSEDHFSVIPNGFDPDDFEAMPPAEQFFTIGYMGTITPQYDISALLEVLSSMKEKLRLRFIGEMPDEVQGALLGTGHRCEFTGYLTHDEALRKASGCAMLLLVIPRVEDNAGIVTGKIFEYLALQRPILGIGPIAGDAAGILAETGAGQMFDYADAGGIRQFLTTNLSRPLIPAGSGAAYSRKVQAEALGRLLEG